MSRSCRHERGRVGVRARRSGLVPTTAAAVALWIASAPTGAAAQASGQVADRPPEQRPADVPELESQAQQAATGHHEVRRGDTLWDLAGHYLTDPFRWPEIFQINTSVVEDPHWIYPGEMLALPDAARIAGRGLETLETWEMARAGTPGRDGVSWFGGTTLFDRSRDAGNVLGELDIDVYAEPALVSASDFYRAPILASRLELEPVGVTARKIAGNPLGLTMLPSVGLNERVVIALGGVSTAAGEMLQGYRWTRGPDGLPMARSMALLQVTEVSGDSARATVVGLFGNYGVGDPVVSVEPYPVTSRLVQTPVEDGMAARLIGFEVEQPLLGEGDMVFLDAGATEGVRIGDEFAVFRRGETASARWEDRLATVRVVRLRPSTATARVVDLREASPVPGAPARLVLRAAGD